MRTSCISHPAKERLIVIHEWQVELCEGNVTAAALLSFFEYWHNIKLDMQVRASRSNDIAELHGDSRTQDEGLLQFHTEEELIAGIMISKRDTIRKAVSYLKDSGFISVCSNPNPKYAFDKTRYFLFHPEPINQWLSEKRPSTKVQLTKSKNRHGRTSSENRQRQEVNRPRQEEKQSAITETSPEITPETSLPPTPQGGEERVKEEPRNEIKEVRANPSVQKTNIPLTSQIIVEEIEQSTVVREDKGSATAVITDPFYNRRTPVQQYGKPVNDFGLFDSQEEMNGFYKELMELGRNLGRNQAAGWASAILRSIKAGEPCAYLEEYRQGIPLGTCDQHEWESRPGVPHEKFISFLTTKFHRTGWTKEQAIAEAHRRIKDTNEAADLWQSCLRTLTTLSADWEKQKALGVSTPYIPPELQSRERISVAEAAQAIASLETPSVTPALSPSPSPSPALPEATTNPDGISQWKPKELTEEDELAAENGKKLLSQRIVEVASKRSLPKSKVAPPDPETVLARLQEMLADPIFMADMSVQAQVQKFLDENEAYCADYDNRGRIVAVYLF